MAPHGEGLLYVGNPASISARDESNGYASEHLFLHATTKLVNDVRPVCATLGAATANLLYKLPADHQVQRATRVPAKGLLSQCDRAFFPFRLPGSRVEERVRASRTALLYICSADRLEGLCWEPTDGPPLSFLSRLGWAEEGRRAEVYSTCATLEMLGSRFSDLFLCHR